jgi:two-component sensor histidine kinase
MSVKCNIACCSRSFWQREKKLEYQQEIRDTRTGALWLLSGLLLVITVMSAFLFRRNRKYRAQSDELSLVNADLDDKVVQVELLNKEMQHRVKNNLHMIYSLLRMQERKTVQEETLEALRAARVRIESIATLHNHLLTTNGGLELETHIANLVKSAADCALDERELITDISAAGVDLPDNKYLPFSLVLNEWLTNSIKYADTQGRALEIHISVKPENSLIRVSYHDNGMQPRQQGAPHLGTEIIQMLTRQMKGELETAAGKPYHYILRIPYGK